MADLTAQISSLSPHTVRSHAITTSPSSGDFLEEGGFGHSLGNNVQRLHAAVGPASRLLRAARAAGVTVVHTLEAHDPMLTNCPPAKKRRCGAIGETLHASMGRVLVEGEAGNAIIDELAPEQGEVVVHKPGKGAFYATGLHQALRERGVGQLIFTGVTTEVLLVLDLPGCS